MKSSAKTVVEKDWLFDRTAQRTYSYSFDELMKAYFDGKKEGQELAMKLMLQQIEKNFQAITHATKQLVSYLKENSYPITTIKMRFDSVSDFTVLTIVPEETFASESFLKVYDFTEKLESSINNEFLEASFRFAGIGGKVNENALLSDGYGLTLKHVA